MAVLCCLEGECGFFRYDFIILGPVQETEFRIRNCRHRHGFTMGVGAGSRDRTAFFRIGFSRNLIRIYDEVGDKVGRFGNHEFINAVCRDHFAVSSPVHERIALIGLCNQLAHGVVGERIARSAYRSAFLWIGLS